MSSSQVKVLVRIGAIRMIGALLPMHLVILVCHSLLHDPLWLLHHLYILDHVDGIFFSPACQLLKVDALAIHRPIEILSE